MYEGVGISIIKISIARGPFQCVNQTGQPPIDSVLATNGSHQPCTIGFELAYFLEFGADALQVITIKPLSLFCFMFRASQARMKQTCHIGRGRR